MNSTKNQLAAKGIVWGTLNRILTTIAPFMVRTLMIYTIGGQYLGLNSVFTSILQILNFAELGFGRVMVYSMYKPIAENDTESICALLNLYRKLYRIIGTIVLMTGLGMLPFLRNFIHGSYPENVNLYLLYIVYLFDTVSSYWLFTYKDSLLSAHQRYYITSNINTIASIVKYAGQTIALLGFRNYYAYAIMIPLCTLINNIGISVSVDRMFPNYKPKGSVDKKVSAEIRKNVLSGLGHKLGPTATTSVDNLVVSSSLGLITAATYNNYNYILSIVTAFIGTIFNSFIAGIGNSLITETKERNYEEFKQLTFMNNWLTGWCSICIICLSQHFMWIWIANKKGMEYMYNIQCVILLALMFYVQQIRTIVGIYKSAAGMWYADRYKPYVSVLMNLVLDIILVKVWGVSGVLLSTILARAAIGLPWETSVMFKQFFKEKQLPYYLDLLKYFITSSIILVVTYFICFQLKGTDIFTLLLKTGICVVVPNILYILLYMRNPYMKAVLKKLKLLILRYK